MMLGTIRRSAVPVVLVLLLAGTSLLAGPSLQNGDFSAGLTGWDYDIVTVAGGVATMGEDSVNFAYLEQEFTIPGSAVSLYFDYRPLFELDGQESFTASLLDPLFFAPLVPTDADPFDPFETYYFMHDWDDAWGVDDVLTDPLYVTQTDLGGGWTRVALDVTSLGGVATDALLAFDFVPGFDDWSYDGEIDIEIVAIQLIPAPSAIILGLVGLGSLGMIRRRFS